ncbi:hypothetical protein KM043_004516 [Ampulex compressa]|nr:hypothetical protein KM043_004516 [Ampulex compressa]
MIYHQEALSSPVVNFQDDADSGPVRARTTLTLKRARTVTAHGKLETQETGFLRKPCTGVCHGHEVESCSLLPLGEFLRREPPVRSRDLSAIDSLRIEEGRWIRGSARALLEEFDNRGPVNSIVPPVACPQLDDREFQWEIAANDAPYFSPFTGHLVERVGPRSNTSEAAVNPGPGRLSSLVFLQSRPSAFLLSLKRPKGGSERGCLAREERRKWETGRFLGKADNAPVEGAATGGLPPGKSALWVRGHSARTGRDWGGGRLLAGKNRKPYHLTPGKAHLRGLGGVFLPAGTPGLSSVFHGALFYGPQFVAQGDEAVAQRVSLRCHDGSAMADLRVAMYECSKINNCSYCKIEPQAFATNGSEASLKV